MKPFNLTHALRFPLIVIITLFCKVNPAFSQASNIIPDNTLGESSSQVIENADGQPNEVITGGAQREQNLFHSFQEFNVSEGRGAFFADPEGVNNIFSRVTGSNPSDILGTLGVNGAANLYLINPNGIVFGENSSLNVQGSFTATTGSGIRFGEQGEFNTINPQPPQSLTINPSAYLFNQIADEDISSIESQGTFLVPEGENLVFLGGDIDLRGSNLVAPGGTVSLGSVNDTAEIGISEESSLIFSDEVARGDISLSEGSSVDVSAGGEGFINVYSQNLNLSQRSQIVAGISQGLGDSDTVGGDIIIDGLGTVSLDYSRITNTIDENASGTTGEIIVSAESVILQKGGIFANIFGLGNAGNIFINATESVIVDGENSNNSFSQISSIILPDAVGNAGSIEINTGSLDVINGGLIASSVFGTGDGGNITINATDSVTVDSGSVVVDEETSNNSYSQISSIVSADTLGDTGSVEINTGSLDVTNGGLIISILLGTGEGGNITINAIDSVMVDGEASDGFNSIISSDLASDGEGNSGDLEITTNSLDVTKGGQISSDLMGTGEGGNITINATESVLVDGESSIDAERSSITSNVASDAVGNAGSVEITTNSLDVTDGGRIRSDLRGTGEGGDVTINATESVTVDGEKDNGSGSRISSDLASDAVGNAGSVEITTNSLDVTDGGRVRSDLRGTGEGGNITITATNSVTVDGEDSDGSGSRISSDLVPDGEGNSGDVEITTNSLDVTDGGLISSDTSGRGDGGNITITATESVTVDGEERDGFGRISSDLASDAEGNSGDLEITTDSLDVTNGGLISSDVGGRGDGGNITITATESVIVNGERDDNFSSRISSIIFPNAQGNSGDLEITTDSLDVINGGLISSDTFGNGDGGEIEIDAEIVLLGEDSTITTKSNSAGNAGNITLNAFNTLLLENSSITSNSSESAGGEITIDGIDGGDIRLRGDSDIETFVSQGVGGGGDITITADSVIAFDDSDIFAFAQDGTGGNIILDTPVFFSENFTFNSLTDNPDFLDNNSRADVNATGAVSGDVSVPDVSFVQSSLSELADNSLNTDELLANSCVVPIGNRGQGQFIITGGESLPVRPGDSLPSRYPTGELRNLPDNNNWQPGDRIVEPQGAYRLNNGKLVLSRQCQ